MNRLSEWMHRSRSQRPEGEESRYFKTLLFSLVGIILLMVIAALTAFLLSLRGPDQTLVPEVRRMDLAEALLELQDRELYPQIQMRVFSDPALRGKVVEQDPTPGTVVRAGKRVSLVVSQGPVVDRVDDFVGRNLNEVRAELQMLFTTFDAVIQIGSVSYVFDRSDPGTILEQSPEPGTEITDVTELDLIVSRGPDVERAQLASYVGLHYEEAIARLAAENRPFVFGVSQTAEAAAGGTVVGQDPAPGTEVVQSAPVSLTIVPIRNVPDGYVFGVFQRALPSYPVAVELTLEAVDPDGEREVVFSMRHPGGALSVPYLMEQDSTLVLWRFNTEVVTYRVQRLEEQDSAIVD
ncbi:MAG: PASTA domain-containing protein [Spirochaetaceae bacterium]|nr:MAG: PASTA domain-containing protein [Spirochaetaceae bacterium]